MLFDIKLDRRQKMSQCYVTMRWRTSNGAMNKVLDVLFHWGLLYSQMSSLRYNYSLEDLRYRIIPSRIASLDICVQIITVLGTVTKRRSQYVHKEIICTSLAVHGTLLQLMQAKNFSQKEILIQKCEWGGCSGRALRSFFSLFSACTLLQVKRKALG